MKIILASTSAYRRELLQRLGVTFECQRPDVDENSYKRPDVLPKSLAETLALAKAKAVLAKLQDPGIVIGSDQVIACHQKIFSKPETQARAIAQLQELTGQTHHLITAVAVVTMTHESVFSVEAKLTMRHDLTVAEIERYIRQDNPLDCAGSYKIESLGPSLFSSIECSDFTAIMGLPLIRLSQELRLLGVACP